jgi:hypothetical protein
LGIGISIHVSADVFTKGMLEVVFDDQHRGSQNLSAPLRQVEGDPQTAWLALRG